MRQALNSSDIYRTFQSKKYIVRALSTKMPFNAEYKAEALVRASSPLITKTRWFLLRKARNWKPQLLE